MIQNQLSLAQYFHMAVNMMLNSYRTEQVARAKWRQYLLATNTYPADTQPGTPFWIKTGKVDVCFFSDGPVCDLILDAFFVKLNMIVWLIKCNLFDVVSVVFWIVFPKIDFYLEP